MTTYLVRHELRKKSIEIEVRPEDEWKISRKKPDFLYSILKEYKRKSRYTGFIDYRGLNFTKKEEKNPLKYTPQEPAFAEPCDKDWCNYCRKGDFDKCPNRR